MLEVEKEKYFKKLDNLFDEGIKNGSITPFDEKLYEKMSNTYVKGIPVSIYVKYLNPALHSNRGKCLDESLYMFFCFNKAILVRGNCKDLEFKDGDPYHGWIEMDDEVYDPSRLLKFRQETFYQLYEPRDISRCNKEQYKMISEEKKELYEEVQSTTLEDLLPNGKRRRQLIFLAPMLQALANVSNNENFKKEVYQYFDSVQYNEIQQEEMKSAFQKKK